MFNGIEIGFIEISLYLFITHLIRKHWYDQLKSINVVSFYWMSMTVLTMIWEFCFIYQYKSVNNYAGTLMENESHVWLLNDYDLSYLLPWKLSKIFYSEYGAYADREYILMSNYWSRTIEGTHAILCGIFSLLAIIAKTKKRHDHFLIALSVSMGTQLMNSILYMENYFIQTTDPNNVNYNNASFPCGFLLLQRGFMYVNIFWTLMPLYTIIMEFKKYRLKYIKNKS